MATNGLQKIVENGKIVDTSASTSSLSSSSKSSGSTLGKEAFLQLLVAQMKYQDPLEPTSNTEYISQLATFSSLEEMQNLNSTATDSFAASLVGKQVILKVTSDTTGATTWVYGQVDYIMREGGKTYLSVDDGLYSIDDLDTVADADYYDAVTLKNTFEAMMSALPSKNSVTLDDKSKVELARKAYDSMTDYQKGFVNAEYVTKLNELEEKIKEMEATQAANEGNTSDDSDPSGDDSTD